jgi:hypothetical protein
LSFLTAILLISGFAATNQGNTAQAAKKGSTVTIGGQKYIYSGRYKHHFSKKEVKKTVQFSKGLHKTAKLNNVAKQLKINGYVTAGLAITKALDFGLGNQLNATKFRTAAKKGTGVTISYDVYASKTGTNYSLARNTKITYN